MATRGGKSGSFAMVHSAVIDDVRVGAAELRVLVALGSYADGDGWCWPRQKHLAERLGISRQAVSKSLILLADHGYIEIERRHDDATGSQIASRYRVRLDYVLPPEMRRTPQPDVAGGVKMTLRPPQRDVAPPATSEVAPIEQTNRTDHMNKPIGVAQRSAERALTLSGRLIDLVKAGGATITMRPQDHKALKDSGADPELVAEAYCAIFSGAWGDDFCRRNLSVQFVIGRLAGYQATKATRRPTPGVTYPTLGSNGTRRHVEVREF